VTQGRHAGQGFPGCVVATLKDKGFRDSIASQKGENKIPYHLSMLSRREFR